MRMVAVVARDEVAFPPDERKRGRRSLQALRHVVVALELGLDAQNSLVEAARREQQAKELEAVGHQSNTRPIAAATSSRCTWNASSSTGAAGTGVRGGVTISTGASSDQNACSQATRATRSATPVPAASSWTTSSLDVRSRDGTSTDTSSGAMRCRSTTSADTPVSWTASSASATVRPL